MMKLSFCPQKILLIRPLAKSFPVMGVWCRCTLHDGGGEYGGGAKVKKSTWNIYAGVSKSSKNGVFFYKSSYLRYEFFYKYAKLSFFYKKRYFFYKKVRIFMKFIIF